MQPKTIIRFFIIVSLILFQVSCAKKPLLRAPAPILRGYPAPPTVEVLKRALLFNQIKSIKSEVTVEVSMDGAKHRSFEGVLFYTAPHLANIRFFSPLGLTALEVVFADNLLQVYIPHKNTIYEDNLSSLENKTQLGDTNISYSMEEEEDSFILVAFRHSEGKTELTCKYTFSHNIPLNTGITLYSKGEKLVDILFDEWSQTTNPESVGTNTEGSATLVPISIKVFLSRYVIKIRLIEPEINTGLRRDYFEPKEHLNKEIKPLKELLKKGGFI